MKIKLLKTIDYIIISVIFLTFLYVLYQSEFRFEGLRRNYYIKYIIFLAIVLIGQIIVSFFKREIKIKIYLIYLSSIFSLFLIEGYLNYKFVYKKLSSIEFMKTNSTKIEAYKKENTKPFDKRSGYKVYKDEIKKNNDIENTIVTLTTSNYLLDNYSLLPLSGKSFAKNIFCNESGYWPIFKLDRFGFKNEDIVWKNDDKIALVGSSFAQGACVNISDDISGRLNFFLKDNNKYTNSINLGQLGHGPISAYASLVEYNLNNKFKKVVWFFNPLHDLKALEKELENKILSKYFFINDFSQQLIKYNNKKDEIVKKKMDKYIDFYEKKFNLITFIKLTYLRSTLEKILKIRQKEKSQFKIQKSEYDFLNFEKIISKFKNYTEKKNIDFIFVYLHIYGNESIDNSEFKKNIFKILINNKIPIVDIENEFRKTNYKDFYPFGMNGHYNKKGYNLVAKKIYEILD